MKYKELKLKSHKECDELLNSLQKKFMDSYLEKSESKSVSSDRKKLKKDIARVLTYKNTIGDSKAND
tara:strand:- start:653 stop:853 length:201 start_codon:yes stop_codon:yes gene_type:complete